MLADSPSPFNFCLVNRRAFLQAAALSAWNLRARISPPCSPLALKTSQYRCVFPSLLLWLVYFFFPPGSFFQLPSFQVITSPTSGLSPGWILFFSLIRFYLTSACANLKRWQKSSIFSFPNLIKNVVPKERARTKKHPFYGSRRKNKVKYGSARWIRMARRVTQYDFTLAFGSSPCDVPIRMAPVQSW